MLRRFSVNFALFSILLDAVTVALSLRLAAELRPYLSNIALFQNITNNIEIPFSLYLFIPLVWIFIFLNFSIYDGKKLMRVVDEFSAVTLATLIAAASVAGILFLSYREISRGLFLLFLILVYGFTLGWRTVARLLFRLRQAQPIKPKRVLVVGAGSVGQAVAERLKEIGNGDMHFVGFVDDFEESNPDRSSLGPTSEINKLIGENQVSDVILALQHSEYHQLSDLVHGLEEKPLTVWVALGFFDLALFKTSIEDFAGIPMLDLRASAINDYQRMIKRAFDILLGVFGMVISLPLLALISIFILLEDGWPFLFQQERVGENGRVFKMLKFRTMVKDADQKRTLVEHLDENGNLIHKTKNDPRVTRVGRFLRRFSLDEIPQIFNILDGTMSFVGPRPEMPHMVEKYQAWQRKRFAVPPGLTGWWQVNGRSDRPMHLHTEYDLYYIQNYSFWLDIQIMIRTIWVVLIGRGSY